MPPGGKRAGAGRPKGSLNLETLDKIQAREHTRKRIQDALDPILDALIAKAQGTKFLVYRDDSGKFIKLSERQAREIKAKNLERLEIWDRPADILAVQECLNRALDKARQPIDANVSGKLTLEQLVSGALSPDDDPLKG